MSNRDSKAKHISLGDDFDLVVVQGGGIRVELESSGNVVVYTKGDVRVRPAADVTGPPTPGTEPQIGDRMEDGTVYAGISPDTNKPMYALPADASLTMKWKDAMEFAANFKAHGHKDWRVPTSEELNVLFQNRARIGGFNQTGSNLAGWYCTSTEHRDFADYAWHQRFSDGYRVWYHLSDESSLRLVRS